MKGHLITHEFQDKIDTLSGQQLFELRDEKGLTIWFGREIHKDVCMTGVCKMIRLWLFWDGVGNHLGIQMPDNEPLTKSDHTPFSDADYKKLESILKDTASVLKDLKPEDLTVETITEDHFQNYQIDGITSATPPSLADAVVKDAVYTCYTLWHTVYGHTQAAIFDILDQRINPEFLSLLFESENPAHLSFAIKSLEKHPEFHGQYYPEIMTLIPSEHMDLADKALDYFGPAFMKNEQVQLDMVGLLSQVSPNKQNRILWKFSELEKTHADVAPALLDLYEKRKIGIGTLSLIYRLVQPDHMKNARVMEILEKLRTHENAYVRNLTERLLNEKK